MSKIYLVLKSYVNNWSKVGKKSRKFFKSKYPNASFGTIPGFLIYPAD